MGESGRASAVNLEGGWGQTRTGGVLGAVPSAAAWGRHSECIINRV